MIAIVCVICGGQADQVEGKGARRVELTVHVFPTVKVEVGSRKVF